MTTKLIFLTLASLLCHSLVFAQADRLDLNENRFYTNKIPNVNRNIENLNGRNTAADSETINDYIERLHSDGGGYLILRPHNNKNTFYLGNIILRSNVHLKIASTVTIKGRFGEGKTEPVFNIGRDFMVENVAVTCLKPNSSNVNDYFKVRLERTPNTKQLAVNVQSAKNFLVSGISITDNYTSISNVTVNLRNNDNVDDRPTKGKIQNIKSINNHVGYGLVQCKAAKTVLFKNLDGEGGVTLRLESGAAPYSRVGLRTMDDVVGKTIKCTNGDASLNLSPHRIYQGQVDVTDVSAKGCTFVVQVAAGFYDDNDMEGLVDQLGTFDEKSYIQISDFEPGNSAQIKSKDIKYFRCGEHRDYLTANKKSNADGNSVYGKSIGIIRTNADSDNGCSASESIPRKKRRGCYKVRVNFPSKTIRGFIHNKRYVYETDAINCRRSSSHEITGENVSDSDMVFNISADNDKLNMARYFTYSIWPNPASEEISIDCPENSSIQIFDASNRLVKQIVSTAQKPTINTSDFTSGLFLVKIKSGKKIITKKLLVK